MADEELELDVNESKKKSPLLLIIIVIVILNAGGIGAWIFLGGDGGGSDSNSTSENKVVLGPLKYQSMVPEFVVNFGPGSKVRYLQIDLIISTRQEDALATVNTYRPVLRNDILIVLSNVAFDDLKNRSGKEALQLKLLDTINKVVNTAGHAAAPDDKKKDGEHVEADKNEKVKGPIENVYFTSFIMQ